MGTPIIPGFHPDPSVCRVGGDYYLVCSSFEYFPGIPVFHSRDLLTWEQIGNALDRPEQLRLAGATSSGGLYAPTLRHHGGKFWLIVTNVSGGGNLLFHAEDPAGPWSDPLPLPGVHGIDPDLAWDEDGNCWCTCAGVSQVRIDTTTGEALGGQTRIWSGSPGAKAPEAPHLHRVGEHWYLLIAEGGTERGHAVSVARGDSVNGPFTPCPDNPVLTHRGTDDPVQNTGHADLVQAVDGAWWLVLLGVRPGGGSPGWHVLGRETFLAPVTWVDGWPVVGEPVTAPPRPAEPVREDFDSPELHPRWISVRERSPERCATTARPGSLTLRAAEGDPEGAFVGRRQQHPSFVARAAVDAGGGEGGLVLRLDERHQYSVELSGGRAVAWAHVGPLRVEVGSAEVGPGEVVLEIEVAETRVITDPRTGPDEVALRVVAAGGARAELAVLDGRYLSTEVAGGFTGRVVGVRATSGQVHVDWFDYEPVDPATA
ncbi:glycoside hydrolase family 43 protein [Actinosynnema pretiosum subsp. pretiosum]|uniref:Glycoside hydrolase family 43 protein n=1 Tax=Actinosynnema pretiosum subsp. pretiosum TaxID=103721 RepID=A0AA45R4T9_9PSEU|nr:Beta-xylosidase [Actinosynnema pretiosum subsp. pretiosum]QUF04968.1 glycoside hydrolase family 43 protein [Actinosynnema pretiosum subsp. pretiosum]